MKSFWLIFIYLSFFVNISLSTTTRTKHSQEGSSERNNSDLNLFEKYFDKEDGDLEGDNHKSNAKEEIEEIAENGEKPTIDENAKSLDQVWSEVILQNAESKKRWSEFEKLKKKNTREINKILAQLDERARIERERNERKMVGREREREREREEMDNEEEKSHNYFPTLNPVLRYTIKSNKPEKQQLARQNKHVGIASILNNDVEMPKGKRIYSRRVVEELESFKRKENGKKI